MKGFCHKTSKKKENRRSFLNLHKTYKKAASRLQKKGEYPPKVVVVLGECWVVEKSLF